MRFTRKQRLLALPALGSIVASAAAFGQANPTDTAAAAQPDIRIEVTGSNIKRVENEGALPVTTITRRDIERSGATTTMELLQQVSANSSLNAVTLGNSVGAVTFSAQTASLRGLGGGRTLVLLNGHRLDTFAGELPGVQGVNLTAIPLQAIDRVEILKDGSSAVYGSDAIAGVINFITRSDYRGAEATAFYGTPTRSGGGDQWQASATVGGGDLEKDGWNAFLSAQYNEQKSLDQVSRNFSNSSYRPDIGLIGISPFTNPGHVVGSNGFFATVNNAGGTPVIANTPALCAPSLFIADFGDCGYDTAAVPGVNMIPHEKTWNVFGSANYRINGDLQAYVSGLYSHDETRLVVQPSPVSSLINFGPQTNIPAAITLLPSSPFYPHNIAQDAGIDGEPLDIWYRTVDNGFRDTTDTNENWQIVGGLKGTWHGFDWDGSLFYAQGDTKEHVNGGFQDYTRLLPILNSGVVNFFGPNTQDIIALERSANFVGDAFHGTSKNYGGQVKASGEVYDLPAGPLAVAVGVEARKEEFEETVDPALENGNITGYPGALKSTGGKDRNQWATFAEINVPIVKTLEGDVAIRYDHYSDFGGTTNPKFSLRWQPAKTVLLRGSYGTGFLAPSLYQLFAPRFGGVTQQTDDPVRCPVTQAIGVDCGAQFNVVLGGNAALKPEESEQTSIGIVLEPIPGASFSVDWFKINLSETIVPGISPAAILADPAQFGNLVTRAPPDPDFPGLPGHITQIDQTFINLGAIRLQGLDIEGRYRTPAQSWGRLTFNISGTYYLKYDLQNPDRSYRGIVGTAFQTATTGVIPRWKHYASLTWDLEPWSATLANTYQTSYVDQNPIDADGTPRTVGSLSLWDLQGSYTGFRDWRLALGVKNLFDRDPPVSNQLTSFISGFDPSYYDPRGRFVYASVSYRFH